MLTEGLVQGVIGTAIGIGLGYLLGVGITAAMNPFMKQLMNIELTPVVEPSLFVVSIVLGVGVTLFSGLLPALSASRVTPMEALRPSLGETMQRISRIGTIVGAVMLVVAVVGLLSGNFALVALGGLVGSRRPGARRARAGQTDCESVRRIARADFCARRHGRTRAGQSHAPTLARGDHGQRDDDRFGDCRRRGWNDVQSRRHS